MNRTIDARTAAAIVAVITFVTFAIGVLNVHRHGIWLDEGYTLSFAMADHREFTQALHQLDGPLVLYYSIVRWLVSTFGHPVETGRLLSVVFGTLLIPAVYWLGARVASRAVGVTAALFLAANTSFWIRVDDLRMYTFATFLSICSYLLFVDLTSKPEAKVSRLLVVASGATTALLFAVQAVFGGLQLVALAASIPSIPRAGREAGLASVAVAAASIAVVAGVLLPLGRTETGWTALVNPLYLGDSVALFGTHLTFGLLAVAGIVALARRTTTGNVTLVTTWVAVPILVATIVSVARPILIDRYLLGALPPFVILAAIGINRFESKYAYTLAAGIVAAELAGTWHVDSVPHEDWNVAAQTLLRAVRPGDVVDVYPRDGVVGLVADLSVHHERLPSSVRIIPGGAGTEWMRNDTIDFVRAKRRGYRGTFPARDLTDDNTVWIVLRNELYWPPPVGYESLLATFRKCSSTGIAAGMGNPIEIIAYRKRCDRGGLPRATLAAVERPRHG